MSGLRPRPHARTTLRQDAGRSAHRPTVTKWWDRLLFEAGVVELPELPPVLAPPGTGAIVTFVEGFLLLARIDAYGAQIDPRDLPGVPSTASFGVPWTGISKSRSTASAVGSCGTTGFSRPDGFPEVPEELGSGSRVAGSSSGQAIPDERLQRLRPGFLERRGLRRPPGRHARVHLRQGSTPAIRPARTAVDASISRRWRQPDGRSMLEDVGSIHGSSGSASGGAVIRPQPRRQQHPTTPRSPGKPDEPLRANHRPWG